MHLIGSFAGGGETLLQFPFVRHKTKKALIAAILLNIFVHDEKSSCGASASTKMYFINQNASSRDNYFLKHVRQWNSCRTRVESSWTPLVLVPPRRLEESFSELKLKLHHTSHRNKTEMTKSSLGEIERRATHEG